MYRGAKAKKELWFSDMTVEGNVNPIMIWGFLARRGAKQVFGVNRRRWAQYGTDFHEDAAIALLWTTGSSEPWSSTLASRMARVQVGGGAPDHNLCPAARFARLGPRRSVLRSVHFHGGTAAAKAGENIRYVSVFDDGVFWAVGGPG